MPYNIRSLLGRFKMVYRSLNLRITCSIYINHFETATNLCEGIIKKDIHTLDFDVIVGGSSNELETSWISL
jgi:hypothetical protein